MLFNVYVYFYRPTLKNNLGNKDTFLGNAFVSITDFWDPENS